MRSICRVRILKYGLNNTGKTFTFQKSVKIENPYISTPVTQLCSLWQNQTRCKRMGSFDYLRLLFRLHRY